MLKLYFPTILISYPFPLQPVLMYLLHISNSVDS